MNTNLKIFYHPVMTPNDIPYHMYLFVFDKEKFCLVIILDENKKIYSIDWNSVDLTIGTQQINLYEIIFDLDFIRLINKMFFNENSFKYFADSVSEKLFKQTKEVIKKIFNELQMPA